MFAKTVLGVIKSFEVASQRPPIFVSPVDDVLVDCCLCFAHRWKGMAPSYKEMSLQLRKRALGLLLSRLENGVLPWGSFTIVADQVGVARSTISRLWRQARGAREQSLIITPEIASRNNSLARNRLSILTRSFARAERNSPASSQNISFHRKSSGGLIEYSATNVVEERCLSHSHFFAEAYADGGEQDVEDGVGPVIRGQEQPKQVQEHGGSHSR